MYVWNLCGCPISPKSWRNNYHKTHLPSQEINLSVTHVCSCVFTMPAIAAARYLCVLTSPVHLRAYPGRHQLRRFMLDDWCSTACASRAVDCFALEKGKGPTVHRPSYTKCCIGETVLAVSIVRWNSMHCWCWLAWILRLARNWNAVPEASEKSFSHKILKVGQC